MASGQVTGKSEKGLRKENKPSRGLAGIEVSKIHLNDHEEVWKNSRKCKTQGTQKNRDTHTAMANTQGLTTI